MFPNCVNPAHTGQRWHGCYSVDDSSLHLATVTLGEIQADIELTREQDTEKAAEIKAWLEQVTYSYNILVMDGPAFRCWARAA